MAVTLSNSAYDTSGASFSYSNNGNFLVTQMSTTGAAPTVATYNGVSMTQIGTSQFNTNAGRFYTMWSLVNPAQGSNTYSWTGGGNVYVGLASFLGVDQTTPYTGLNTAGATGANPTIAVTTTVNNAMVIAGGLLPNTPTAGTNTTLALTVVGAAEYIFRSTTNVTPAGSFTINITMTSGEYTLKAFGVNPAATTQGNFLTFM